MNNLTLNDYQAKAARTAIYPGAGSGGTDALTYLALGLGEAGELQGKVKKILRDKGGEITPDTVADLIAEGGDVLWYLAMFFSELGVPLEHVTVANLAKLASRAERDVLGGSGDHR